MILDLLLNLVEENSPSILNSVEIVRGWSWVQLEMFDIVVKVQAIVVTHVKIHVCKGNASQFWVIKSEVNIALTEKISLIRCQKIVCNIEILTCLTFYEALL